MACRQWKADLTSQQDRSAPWWPATKPLNVTDGFDGDVVLCIDVPEDLFGEFDESQEKFGYRIALVAFIRG